MKIIKRSRRSGPFFVRFWLWALMTVATLGAAPNLKAASGYLRISDPAGTSSLTSPLTGGASGWTNGALGITVGIPAGRGTNYFTAALTLRSPSPTTSGNTYIFQGDSLSLDAGGRLLGKIGNNLAGNTASNTIIITNLVLNGGWLDQAGVNNDNSVLTVAGSINVNAASMLGALGGTANSSSNFEALNIASTISGPASLTVSGSGINGGSDTGVVRLSAANPYSGIITVTNGNTGVIASSMDRVLQLNHLNALSNATLNLTASQGNPVSFNSTVNTGMFKVGALAGTSPQILSDTTGDAVILCVGGNNANTTYSGALSGSGGLIKIGTGTFTLSGAVTYTGNTIVSNGSLVISGSSFTRGGAILMAGAAALTLGYQPASVIVPSLTLGSASTNKLSLDLGVPSPTGEDAVIYADTVVCDGPIVINISGINLAAGGFYPLIISTSASGLQSFQLGTLPSGVTGALVRTNNSLYLDVVSAPAPVIVSPPVNIMPLGDSITYGVATPAVGGGYRAPLNTLLTNLNYSVNYVGNAKGNPPENGLNIWHEGHPGAELQGVDALLGGVFNEIDDPDIILLLLGTNDYSHGKGSEATNHLNQLITDLATRRPMAKILVAGLTLRTDNSALWSQISTQYNASIPSIVAAQVNAGHQVYAVNLNAGFDASCLSPDGLHPNARGYNVMATNWLSVITNVITPRGTTNAPILSHVVGCAGLTNIIVTFSKPVGNSATNLGNYHLNGGLNVLGATFDFNTRRKITLWSSTQAPDTSYVLSVSNVTDYTSAATPMTGAAWTFLSSAMGGATNSVAEAGGYKLVYSIDLPTAANYSTGSTNPIYSVDNHAGITNTSRVAYYLELRESKGPLRYVWVSMDSFTQNSTKMGIPTLASGAVFQQNVTNMNVYSDVSAIVAGTGMTGGNIEFWPYGYNPTNKVGVPGANDAVFDFGDQSSGGGNYGSMQIANHDAGQMLISLNGWGRNNTGLDLGIGNNLLYCTDTSALINSFTSINPDWTFRGNAGAYTVKRLQVYVTVPGGSGSGAVFEQGALSMNAMGGQISLNCTGITGRTYTLQRSTNLLSWTTVLTTNAPFQFVEEYSLQPAAFYRLQYSQ